jgi:hypothetical protein
MIFGLAPNGSTGETMMRWPTSSPATIAIGYLRTLFATPRSPGIRLAADALAQVVGGEAVTQAMVGYTRSLLERVDLAR